jgi:hypothetical protein
MKNKNQQNLTNHQETHEVTNLIKSGSKGDQLLANLFKKRLPIINDPNPTNPPKNLTATEDNSAQHSSNTADENVAPEKAAFDAYETAIKLLPKD